MYQSGGNNIHRNGFTLVELLLYVALAGTLLFSASMVLATLFEVRVKTQTMSEVDAQGNAALQIIAQALRNASSIQAPATQAASTTGISLAMYTAGVNPTVFSVSDGILFMREGTGIAIPLTNSRVGISDLLVTNLSRPSTPGIVRVSFTLSYLNPSGRNEFNYSKSFTTSASLRQP